MKNKFTSLSLGIIFSLSCLTGKTIAMEGREEESIIDEVTIEENLGGLICCEYNDGKQLTIPEDKEKSDIKKVINLYKAKDALDCLKKLVDNRVSTDIETLYSKRNCSELHDCNFRLDQPAKVTTENQPKISTKGKKNKTDKYRNKRNKNFINFDDTSTGSSSTSDNSFSDETASNEKGEALVIINVQKGNNTYCEVIVKRDVLKHFGLLSNKTTDPDSKLRETINKIMNDADEQLSELCQKGRSLNKKNLETWKKGVLDEGFYKLNKPLRNELVAKLSRSQDAKNAWDKFCKEGDKEKIRSAWNNLKTNLSNLLNVKDNENKDDIDNKKLDELAEKIKEALKESLKNKKVYAIYFK